MKKFIFYVMFLLCGLTVLQTNNFGQAKQTNTLLEYSFESFEYIANSQPKILLFKVMQFRAPYRGGYIVTSVTKNGEAFNARVNPFAVQASRNAKLNLTQVAQLRKQLATFTQDLSPSDLHPIDDELYTTLIFETDGSYSRYNFTGKMPAQLQSIVDSLKPEFEKAEAREYEEFLATEKMLKEKYGDWLNKPGIIRPATNGFQHLTDNKKTLLYQKGYLQPLKSDKPAEIPLYYALVSYESGRVISGVVGGHGSSDPISITGITWSLANSGERDTKENQRSLKVAYNAINGTIRIENKIYKLSEGNFFTVEMTPDWKPLIKQLKVSITQPITEAEALYYFKVELKDNTLELPKILSQAPIK